MRLGLLIGLAIIAAMAPPIVAEEEANAEQEKEIESPSPDGRLAFLSTFSTEQRTLDLIEKESEKVLLRVAESEEGSNRLSTEALWASDSKRFALMISIYRRSAYVSVYLQQGDTFHEVKLPNIPEARIPKKLENDKKHFWHVASSDWAKPVEWRKDGSLVVESETTIDGNGNTATATRTTVIGFDRSGKARIVSSTQKVTTEYEEESRK